MSEEKERTKDIELNENVTFDDLMLSIDVLNGLKLANYSKPSPIQLKAIPLGKLGLDLIVQAKSGTGKTLVFSIIALENIIIESKLLQVLILAPTREVALQISNVIKRINIVRKKIIKVHSFIGGHSLNEDKLKLKLCHIAVGTPGRISHLIKENLLNSDNIRLFVLDEADKLLSSEFQEDINFIYSNLPENKQMVVLSATYPYFMATYVTRYMRSATFVRLNIVDPSLRGIKQYYKRIEYNELKNLTFDLKINELIKLLSTTKFKQCIVFTNYQIRAENLCQKLVEKNWPAIFIAGNIEQAKRNKAIMQLKQFKCRILVSTDLTARGIDAENVDLIVCMDVPADAETYLHRIGRAGRYGCYGLAVSFVCEIEELKQFENIINKYKLRICQYGKNFENILMFHNNTDEKSLIDDVKIERVQVNDDELVNSLQEYEKAKEKQSRLFSSIKKNRDAKNKRNRVTYNFNNFNSIEDVESSFLRDKKFISSDKYKDSIQKLENLVLKNKKSFESKYTKQKLKLSNLIKAKLNGEQIDDTQSESSSFEITDTESDIESEEDNTTDNSDDEKTKLDYQNKLFAYHYYYNYYYSFYFKHFMNSNK